MTATIGPACAPAPGIAPAQPNDSTADTASAPSEGAGAESVSSEHPLAKLGIGDLHRLVQAFAPPGAGQTSTLLAPFQAPPQGNPQGPQPGAGVPLYDTQKPGAPGTELAAAPKPPFDMAVMEKMNAAVQRYDLRRTPGDDKVRDDVRDAKAHFKAATDALKAGDYKTAANHFKALGLPLPSRPSDWGLTARQGATAIAMGMPVIEKGNSFELANGLKWGKGGDQRLNDLNGFAANAVMMARLADLKGGASNPPTEAQVTQYMREFANPPTGPKPTPQQVMQAASEITNGLIMHYSSAGKDNPSYGNNPNWHPMYKGADGQVYEFNSMAAATTAMNAKKPEIAPGARPVELRTQSPTQWSDIALPGQRAGRYVGDCESKVFVQTRLLTAAGFTSLGSVDVQHEKNGHMFGVFKDPAGKIWVTSNEEFKQVVPAKSDNGVVTQAHLDYTLMNMTAELYHVEVIRDKLEGFNFSSAATANQKTPNPATDTIRRSSELNMMGKTEPLIPPPPKKP